MKKRYIALLVLLVAAVTAYTQRGAISERIYAKAVATAMVADPWQDFNDGLHVVVCGAGGPLPDPRRSGPCLAVIAGERMFVVDAGTNGLRNLNRMRLPLGDIEAVLLTHFHSDHIDGLGELATMRWVNGNKTEALPAIGPSGVETVVAGFNMAYGFDRVARNDHHGDSVAPLSGHGMIAKPFAVPANGESVTVLEDADLTIQMVKVDHDPVKPAVGYLFKYKDRSVFISGDTDQSDNIVHFAKGVDLLVHEALGEGLVRTMQKAAQDAGAKPRAKILFDILDYHASPVEAAETARDAGAGHLLYYHIVPVLLLPGMEAAWLEGVDEVFSDYTVSVDGTRVSLPVGSKAIDVHDSAL
ncbi:MAG: MBL fold metallo-hydrolase [Pseudomonadales bacterium]